MSEIILGSRFDLHILMNARGLIGDGVEVGVAGGCYSNYLLTNSKLSRLFSVDPWNKPEDKSIPYLADPNLYLETVKVLLPHGLRTIILRMYSLDAAKFFADESLDFVYIDANHGYKWIKEDIEAWFPKVKKGGLFCGHDYSYGIFDVKRAVDEFVIERNIQTLYLTKYDQTAINGAEVCSWIIFK